MKKGLLSRRTFMERSGIMITLPLLDCMLPWSESAWAQAAPKPRLIILYKPNGSYTGSWNAQSVNSLPNVLSPLNAYRNEITLVQGLYNSGGVAYENAGNASSHGPKGPLYLSGGKMTVSTSTVEASKTIDQIVAESRGVEALTLAGPRDIGTDGAYNGEYFKHISWIGPRYAPNINNARDLFDKIFSSTSGSTTPTQPTSAVINKVYKKSIIDFVRDGANAKLNRLGTADKAKLDEFLTGVREIEAAILKDEQTRPPACSAGSMSAPARDNAFEVHTKLMLDLMVKAVECGRLSVCTYMMDVEQGYGYRKHHDVSHWTDSSSYPQTLQEIDQWYVQQYAYFIGKLAAISEAGGTALSNSVVTLGSGHGSGEVHTNYNLPLVIAGRAGGTINPARVLNHSRVKISNLWLTLGKKVGTNIASLGDSNGTIGDL